VIVQKREKLVAYTVVNVVKAKIKIGMGCKNKKISLAAKKNNKKWRKNGERIILTTNQLGSASYHLHQYLQGCQHW
jgi:hypothetical protein